MSHACRGIGALAHTVVLGLKSVRNRTSVATGAALLIALGMSAAPVFALRPGATKTEIPLYETFQNPCTGESVLIEGTTTLFIYNREKRNGTFEMTVRVKQEGVGHAIDASGLPIIEADGTDVRYRFHSEETTKFADIPTGASESAVLAKTMLVRKGELPDMSQDDWVFKHVVRIKVDEFGNTTMHRERSLDTCPAE